MLPTRDRYDRYYANAVHERPWAPFYNHGYSRAHGSDFFAYDREDAPWNNQCNLYSHALSLVSADYARVKLLDIGCGLGHGPSVYKKYFEVGSVTAIDISPTHILFAKQHFDNVNYLVGDATNLSFKNDTFDVVTNVESLHCYRHVRAFYEEAYRVLATGGYLLVTDPFAPRREDVIAERFFSDSGFRLEDKRDITDNVSAACEHDARTFRARFPHVDECAVRFFIDIFKRKHLLYASRTHVYLTYVLLKP